VGGDDALVPWVPVNPIEDGAAQHTAEVGSSNCTSALGFTGVVATFLDQACPLLVGVRRNTMATMTRMVLLLVVVLGLWVFALFLHYALSTSLPPSGFHMCCCNVS
jgi:hypothetical protein